MIGDMTGKCTCGLIADWPTEKRPLVVLNGDTRDVIRELPDNSFQCAVTSPPYWGVRDYGVAGQIGAEMDLQEYLNGMALNVWWMRKALL